MPFDVIIGRNESDKKAFGKRGLAYLGKSFVTMGNYTSLSNPIYMDVARSHVILVIHCDFATWIMLLIIVR